MSLTLKDAYVFPYFLMSVLGYMLMILTREQHNHQGVFDS